MGPARQARAADGRAGQPDREGEVREVVCPPHSSRLCADPNCVKIFIGPSVSRPPPKNLKPNASFIFLCVG